MQTLQSEIKKEIAYNNEDLQQLLKYVNLEHVSRESGVSRRTLQKLKDPNCNLHYIVRHKLTKYVINKYNMIKEIDNRYIDDHEDNKIMENLEDGYTKEENTATEQSGNRANQEGI